MNYTPNYDLPLYQGNDETSWLSTWNGAMSGIDAALADIRASIDGSVTGVADAKAAADSAAASATAAQNSATAAQGLAATANTNANAALGIGNTLMERSGDAFIQYPVAVGTEDIILSTLSEYTVAESGVYVLRIENQDNTSVFDVLVDGINVLTFSKITGTYSTHIQLKEGQKIKLHTNGSVANIFFKMRALETSAELLNKYVYNEVTA